MLRVCGVTFDHTTNYGSSLQALALKRTIDRIIIKSEHCCYDLLPYTLVTRNTSARYSIKGGVHGLLRKLIVDRRRKQFESFEHRCMSYADLHSLEDLQQISESYDTYICGSDVIWNYDFTNGDKVYFLEFTNKYKFSYAASFGVNDIKKDFHKTQGKVGDSIREGLVQLDSISVRERAAVQQVREVTAGICTAVKVVDPVLLLSADEWNAISDQRYKPRYKYIFAYSTYISPNFLSFLKTLKKQTRLKVVHVTWDPIEAVKQKALRYYTPDKWISLLRNAEYVVTNSFHACAFSVIYKKKFFAVMRDTAVVGTRIRLYDFLAEYNLKDRIYGFTPDIIPETPPDYATTDDLIKQKKDEALEYIRNNLTKALYIKENR